MARPIVFVYAFLFGFLYCAPASLVRAIVNPTTTSDLGITYKLYNRNHPNGIPISPNDTEQELRSVFIIGIGVKFITHGWMEDTNRDSVVTIRKAYGITSDYNVVPVDWRTVSRLEYALSTSKVPEVGKEIANMVNYLISLKLTTLDLVHLIGHSLGGHVMGVAARQVTLPGDGQIGRLSGLDPAGPLYENFTRPLDHQLDREDAKFVDVIHTSVGVYGFRQPLGDADFYPNGGSNNQPGCNLILNFLCGHQRSYLYFAQSIYEEDAYPAVPCDSYESFLANKCKNESVVYMGDPASSSARGKYYLKANFNETIITQLLSGLL